MRIASEIPQVVLCCPARSRRCCRSGLQRLRSMRGLTQPPREIPDQCLRTLPSGCEQHVPVRPYTSDFPLPHLLGRSSASPIHAKCLCFIFKCPDDYYRSQAPDFQNIFCQTRLVDFPPCLRSVFL
ncbi:hypothetical protein BGY98DRAFT_621666 [Russula aff. rugulosa BPL654]|nr:hypothetical protein BGY98DRAFT_621666 [Russula aff. rugulosa BPL654]